MTEPRHNARLWIRWAILTLVLATLTGAVFVDQKRQHLDTARERLDTELSYLSHILQVSLQSGDFDQARQQIAAWGELNRDTVWLQLIADTGFVIGDFRRAMPVNRIASRETEVAFGYDNKATLRLEKSLQPVHALIAQLRYTLVATFLVFELLGSLLIYQFYRHERQVAISEREYDKRLEAQTALRRMATQDALTGLPNRHRLNEQLDLRISEASRFERKLALLFIDLDNFKTVNDTYGHDTGDRLLKVIADRMAEQLRGYDLLARFGGDEFVILLANFSSVEEVENVAEKLITTFDDVIRIDELELFASCSVGISLYPQDADSAGEMLRTADAAMYTAKEAGKNCFRFFLPEMNEAIAERQQIETGLRQAIELGTLSLHYQPEVELSTGRIIACEALLRWYDGEREWMPDDFLPIAEQTALMLDLQRFAIAEATKQCAEWKQVRDVPWRVNVNLSGKRSVLAKTLPELPAALRDAGVNCDDLGIEVSEATLEAASTEILADFRRMQGMGCRVLLDNFGSGASSLESIRQMPVDDLKIDRTLIAQLHDESMSTVVNAIIMTGHALGKQLVAEGVETNEQIEFLAAHGCDRAQGNVLYPPMPADKLLTLITDPDVRSPANRSSR